MQETESELILCGKHRMWCFRPCAREPVVRGGLGALTASHAPLSGVLHVGPEGLWAGTAAAVRVVTAACVTAVSSGLSGVLCIGKVAVSVA